MKTNDKETYYSPESEAVKLQVESAVMGTSLADKIAEEEAPGVEGNAA